MNKIIIILTLVSNIFAYSVNSKNYDLYLSDDNFSTYNLLHINDYLDNEENDYFDNEKINLKELRCY